MKKNILVHGLIAGVVVSSTMLYMVSNMSYCEGNLDYTRSMVIGYASMLIAFSLVYVGIRNYRNKFSNGEISFGKAFKIGFLIVLVASTIYVAAWLVDYYCFIPDFAEKYSAHALETLKAKGASPEELQKQTAEMADFTRMYKNPLFVILVTYSEILPIGLVVALISSLILKRKSAAGKE